MAVTPTKLTGADYAITLERAKLPPEVQAPLRDCAGILDALTRLETAGFTTEAVRVMAYALPKREGVWWACMCALHTAPPDLPESARLARETAELWVRQQKDEQRRGAFAHAEKNEFNTPEAWCAAAAFWSGDSLGPVDFDPVPPAPHLTGTAVTGALVMASLRGDLKRQPERLKRFLESGRNIAEGGPGRIPPEAP